MKKKLTWVVEEYPLSTTYKLIISKSPNFYLKVVYFTKKHPENKGASDFIALTNFDGVDENYVYYQEFVSKGAREDEVFAWNTCQKWLKDLTSKLTKFIV